MRRSLRVRSPGLDRALVELTRAANYSRLWLLVAGGLAACGGRRGRGPPGAASSRSRSRRPSRTAPPSCSCAGAVRRGARVRRSSACRARRRSPPGHSAAAFAFATGACERAAGRSRRCSCRWRAPLPTRACTPAFTIRATSRPAPRSGSARACSPRACRGGSASDAVERERRMPADERAELNPGRTLGAGRSRRSAPISARGCERTSSPASCWRRSSFRRAWPTPSWPDCRRSPASTRRSPAWSATRCSGPRGCSCSDPTPRSRR